MSSTKASRMATRASPSGYWLKAGRAFWSPPPRLPSAPNLLSLAPAARVPLVLSRLVLVVPGPPVPVRAAHAQCARAQLALVRVGLARRARCERGVHVYR